MLRIWRGERSAKEVKEGASVMKAASDWRRSRHLQIKRLLVITEDRVYIEWLAGLR